MQQKLRTSQLNKSLEANVKLRFEYLPSLISLIRLIILPFFAYSFLFGFTLLGYGLFLFVVITDFLDGYSARKLQVTSKFGAYYDAAVDMIFIISMFGVFYISGFYPYWVILLILFMFVQFELTAFFLKIIYDPVGKYYGSLLYGAIGLTLLFSGQLFYHFIIYAIVVVTALSLLSRIVYGFYLGKNRKTDSKLTV